MNREQNMNKPIFYQQDPNEFEEARNYLAQERMARKQADYLRHYSIGKTTMAELLQDSIVVDKVEADLMLKKLNQSYSNICNWRQLCLAENKSALDKNPTNRYIGYYGHFT